MITASDSYIAIQGNVILFNRVLSSLESIKDTIDRIEFENQHEKYIFTCCVNNMIEDATEASLIMSLGTKK